MQNPLLYNPYRLVRAALMSPYTDNNTNSPVSQRSIVDIRTRLSCGISICLGGGLRS